MFGGSNDTHIVSGKISRISADEIFYTISGKWNGTTLACNKKSGVESVVFDGPREPAKERIFPTIEEQEEFESRR